VDSSVVAAADNGVRMVLIAGNKSDNAIYYSPGRVSHTNVWTVTSFKLGDTFSTSFSNYGDPPVINYSEPGEHIQSLQIGGGSGYGFGPSGSDSGTSYSAPILAGLLLATPYGVASYGVVSSDPDGDPDSIGVASDDNLQVFISGPQFVANGYQGTWDASASGGTQPYSYVWYRKNGIGDLFHQVGTGSSYTTTVTESFSLKVKVTEAYNFSKTSSIFNVTSN
jgi:hypothetical protein